MSLGARRRSPSAPSANAAKRHAPSSVWATNVRSCDAWIAHFRRARMNLSDDASSSRPLTCANGRPRLQHPDDSARYPLAP
jgi:hypothetical protein